MQDKHKEEIGKLESEQAEKNNLIIELNDLRAQLEQERAQNASMLNELRADAKDLSQQMSANDKNLFKALSPEEKTLILEGLGSLIGSVNTSQETSPMDSPPGSPAPTVRGLMKAKQDKIELLEKQIAEFKQALNTFIAKSSDQNELESLDEIMNPAYQEDNPEALLKKAIARMNTTMVHNENQLTENNSKIESLEQHISSLEKQMEVKEIANRSLHKQIAEIQERPAAMPVPQDAQAIKELESLKQQVNDYKQKNNDLRAQIGQSNLQQSEDLMTITTLRQEKRTFEDTIKSLQRDLKDVLQQMEYEKENRQVPKAEKAFKGVTQKEFEELQKQLNLAEDNNEVLVAKNAALSEKLNTMKQDTEILEEELAEKTEKIKVLKQLEEDADLIVSKQEEIRKLTATISTIQETFQAFFEKYPDAEKAFNEFQNPEI
jgi:chromosome segregation ATPase